MEFDDVLAQRFKVMQPRAALLPFTVELWIFHIWRLPLGNPRPGRTRRGCDGI